MGFYWNLSLYVSLDVYWHSFCNIFCVTPIKRYNSEVIPAIILIPSNKGSLNIGLANIDKNVEKVIGSNIL